MTALLTALAPDLHYWFGSLMLGVDGNEGYAWMALGSCLGHEIYSLIGYPQLVVAGFPLFQYGGAPLIVLGFAGWFLSVRRGRDRLGRIIGRSVAAVLFLLHLPEPLLITLDEALGPGCMGAWGPQDLVSWRMGVGLYLLAPPLLVLFAVRAPRREFVRRGPLARMAAAVLAVVAIFLLAAESAPAGRVSSEWELDCAGFGDGTVRGLNAADKRFLCQIRGYDFSRRHRRVAGWNEIPDQEVLAQGHHLCELATRHGGDVGAPAVQEAPQASLAGALAGICPAVARAQEAEERRRREENHAYVAGKEKACAAHPRHRPKMRPVRQRRATMWTEFWTINGWDEGYEGTIPELVEDLVGSDRGALTIWAADEIGRACVTVESYTRRPPLELRGWEEVVEVGYESPSGSLSLVDGWGNQLSGLTSRGPGAYRVRVHLRGRKLVYQAPDPPDGAVQLLIMVFPGKEKKPVVYR